MENLFSNLSWSFTQAHAAKVRATGATHSCDAVAVLASTGMEVKGAGVAWMMGSEERRKRREKKDGADQGARNLRSVVRAAAFPESQGVGETAGAHSNQRLGAERFAGFLVTGRLARASADSMACALRIARINPGKRFSISAQREVFCIWTPCHSPRIRPFSRRTLKCWERVDLGMDRLLTVRKVEQFCVHACAARPA